MQIKDYISYSDFNELSRKILKGGEDLPNVPKVFHEFLQKKSEATKKSKWIQRSLGLAAFFTGGSESKLVERPQIMLLDEVDVFFGDGFYGQPYR